MTPREGVAQESLDVLAAEVSEDVGIQLEHEATYDWVAFVPRRDSEAGALTKYFGALAGEDRFKYRGIECRQQSTSPFVAEVQRELVEVFDAYRSPEAVCDRVQAVLQRLRDGDVAPEELAVTTQVSKHVEEYQYATRTVAALAEAERISRDVQPGQSVEYVVVDDAKSSQKRVALVDEAAGYDAAYYSEQIIRAAESILSPLGWREKRSGRSGSI